MLQQKFHFKWDYQNSEVHIIIRTMLEVFVSTSDKQQENNNLSVYDKRMLST